MSEPKLPTVPYEHPAPPSFEEAKNRRTKVRSAGLDPNYWYAVEHDDAIGRGQIVEVTFWGTSVALYRGEDGRLRALENRCAHRHVPLTVGVVQGRHLVCQYHGWTYNGAGELAEIPHELFGKKKPRCKLRTYPVRVRYGLVWIFFGDPERADDVPMPEIPELEGPDPWACVPVDFTWKCHHSMIIDNVSDFTHAFLHRKYAPFTDAKLTRLETVGDSVELSYDTKVGRGKISGLFVDRESVDTNSMDLAYEYPYQWSNTDDKIKHWLFVLPIDEHTTRAFFLFYFDSFVVPFTKVRIPKRLMKPFLRISNELLVKPLLSEDGVAVEAEQRGWEEHWHEPLVELNPAVNAFQALTVRKWEAYLERQRAAKEQKELVRLERRRQLGAADGAE
ncbi:MAG TPA: Rieske 2Fe-2S domain-containing protein [Sandaracinaceae bacterium LLY-WYZ-13_1]|nr:Rieske 2Fe-2S domain-containing protein [Sandaracinaceae bacterium LLY-WYZ-13_1]